jgi:hypothetical protein
MAKIRPAVLISAALATGALALTLDELLREQPAYFSWPNGSAVGVLVLAALIAATWWLVRDTRLQSGANAWAKSALALAISVPFGWIATERIAWGKLRALPDGDMPDGVVEAMNGDVLQMQLVALVVTATVLACIAMTARRESAV